MMSRFVVIDALNAPIVYDQFAVCQECVSEPISCERLCGGLSELICV